MRVLPLQDASMTCAPGMTVQLQTRGETCRCTVRAVRRMPGCFVLSCDEITDRNRAAAFRGGLLAIPAPSIPPRKDGEYLREEIIGRIVTAADGEELGRIVDIMRTSAHDIYVVADGGREYLIPAVREFILEISRDEAKIVVKKMEGMFQ